MPELILSSGGAPVLRCPLHGQAVTVGQSPANDISIPDDGMPPFHCSFEPTGQGGYVVVDRGGKGVDVGALPVQRHALKDGDEIRLGRLVGRFVQQGAVDEDRAKAGQRTGILRTRGDGALARIDLRLRLPAAQGGKLLEVTEAGIRFGANPDNDVVIDDGFVSSFHAQVFIKGERLVVRDLDSTNGTFVGNVRVVEAEVPVGATLRLGKAELKVEPVESEEAVIAPSGKGPWRCGDMVTGDEGFARTFALIEKVAPHDATVCIFGETGTGKELVAHAMHKLGGRRSGPFVPLNCAAIPANLIESELFGHEKGAFTGADRLRKGVFEEAHTGTLFLDEIGEVPIEQQAKLLRVLETRSVRRIGGRGDIPVDVRVVAATHRDLVQHVRDGRFREDLLHRLYVIAVKLPPLRERPVDIGYLAKHFVEALSPASRRATLAPGAERKLRAHPFPGNVRELRNVIQRALILGDGKTVTEKDIEFIPTSLAEVQGAAQVFKPGMTLDDVEREAIKIALATYGTAAEAARGLGMPKTTLWRKATALGLLKKDEPAPKD